MEKRLGHTVITMARFGELPFEPPRVKRVVLRPTRVWSVRYNEEGISDRRTLRLFGRIIYERFESMAGVRWRLFGVQFASKRYSLLTASPRVMRVAF